jgi:hypothetical protein
MNWAKASGTSIFRSDALVGCPMLTMLSTVAYLPAARITLPEWDPHLSAPSSVMRGRSAPRCCWRSVSAGQRYLTSSPVTVLPMIIRWISDVPSKIVKIFASRCQRSTGYSRV